MNITQICTAIQNDSLDNNDLNLVIEAVKYRRSRIARETKAALTLGDSVNFTSSRTGQNVTGVVVKIAIKYVTVKTAKGSWRVPANMLTVIRDSEFA